MFLKEATVRLNNLMVNQRETRVQKNRINAVANLMESNTRIIGGKTREWDVCVFLCAGNERHNKMDPKKNELPKTVSNISSRFFFF